nr:DNA mismatch repair protein MSH4 isoform X2 [Ipomoea batatas]
MVGRGIFPFQIPQASYHSYQGQKQRKGSLLQITHCCVQNLEIIEPMHSGLLGTSNKKRSLFQMLKTTKTFGGTRLLRANILQPLKDIKLLMLDLTAWSMLTLLIKMAFMPKFSSLAYS